MPNLNQALPPLLEPLDKDEILAYLKELKPALQKDGIIELGLFGSYAKGTASASSDIDIFIRTSDEFHKNAFLMKCEKFGWQIKNKPSPMPMRSIGL